jgi:phenylacetate-coenzyme A ligase PaaK-like adenylate-forming protein
MDARARLLTSRHIYRPDEALFTQAMRENAAHHARLCPFYAELLRRESVDISKLKSYDDCARLPVLPAALFKRHEILSLPREEIVIHATSSGTQGQKSQVFLDADTLRYGTGMVVRLFRHHRLISAIPTNYIMLGYQPSDGNDMGAVKTAMGVTRFAPALHREFVLKKASSGYQPDWFGVLRALRRYESLRLPVRFVGFPAFLHRLLLALKQEGITLKLNRQSLVLLGGGWKQFSDEQIDKHALYAMAEELLGIPAARCRDFYSAVEHPVAYVECTNHHMHVPMWSRVVIRDINTLMPLGFNQPGLLSFMTPLVNSAPLLSVMMGDIAVLHDGKSCGCGVETPYFEVLGRAGRAPLRNCAVTADELVR